MVQVIGNLLAWVVVAPVLDILIYAEPVKKVFAQGAAAFVANIIAVGVLGTILTAAYSKIEQNHPVFQRKINILWNQLSNLRIILLNIDHR